MAGTESTGACLGCGLKFSKRGIAKHLSGCFSGAPGSATGLHLVADGGGPYWLHLFAAPDATLESLDAFLRKIWLECCGHMSEFYGNRGQIGKRARLSSALGPGVKLRYEYDMGSTTALEIRFLGAIRAPAGKARIRLLARNDPPGFGCAGCGKPAEMICPFCGYSEAGLLCRRCSKGHACDDGVELMPLVNSPRTGVCGYTG